MNCAENLLRDHDDIAAMLRALAASAARLEQGRYVDPAMLHGLDTFMQEFVSGCYFRKAEGIFLPHVRAVLPDDTARTYECSGLRARCLVPISDLHGVIGRVLGEGLEEIGPPLAEVAARLVARLTAYLDAERPLLNRLRRRPADPDDEALLRACGELERRLLGAARREWYAQLAADYADITRSWMDWPATAGAPSIRSGRTRPAAAFARV